MKSKILQCTALLTLVLGSLASGAQSTANLAVKVPFDFMVGVTMFPAGKYSVRPVSRQTYVLAAQHGAEFVVMKTRPALLRSSSRAGGLVFVNDGHHYRLREVKMHAAGREELATLPHLGKPVWVAAADASPNSPQIIRTGKDY
ncbi:MAG TPA: hypothetical protein VHV29_01420 [Terriglobales bacterium]|jgi:hypothetical protein|nr:hypothetical protein [Terriglobales bacterium]